MGFGGLGFGWLSGGVGLGFKEVEGLRVGLPTACKGQLFFFFNYGRGLTAVFQYLADPKLQTLTSPN